MSAWTWFGLAAHVRSAEGPLALCGLDVTLGMPRAAQPDADQQCARCALVARLRPREHDLDALGLTPLGFTRGAHLAL